MTQAGRPSFLSPDIELISLLTDLSDEYVVALTLYGEGRRDPHSSRTPTTGSTGLRAIAWVLYHRVHDAHGRWSRSYKVACLQRGPTELACWYHEGSRIDGLLSLARWTLGGAPPVDNEKTWHARMGRYEQCRRFALAAMTVRDTRDDLVRGANCYHRHGTKPSYLLSREPVATVDGRLFYRL